jgi:imidazolonepropionase-like amidohydrolase
VLQVAPVIVSGGTIIDATGAAPVEASLWIESGRIRAIGREGDFPGDVERLDARGKFVVPGYMNANVHLLLDTSLETLATYLDRYEELIEESAQVALKNGLTTVFDTWGPRRHLMAVRDKIAAGELVGSRIFCAGNIVGFDGPYSHDFRQNVTQVASKALVDEINAIWVENSGRHLMWLSPDEVYEELRAYIARGIDFVKYGSNEHFGTSAGAFLAFSPPQQEAIVRAAHDAGVTAQAHCMAIEGLRIAIEAGCDLITHCNITGPVPIPESTLELFNERDCGAVIFPWTEQGMEWIKANVTDVEWTIWDQCDVNARNLIRSGASLMVANDGAILAAQWADDPLRSQSWGGAPEGESLMSLGAGHFFWFRAMEEKGCDPMRMLQAATRNIANHYGKGDLLGTLEVGKIADLLLLDANPLEGARNFDTIGTVVKDGRVVDRDALPRQALLTRRRPPAEEQASFKQALSMRARFPSCPTCHWS